MEASVMSSLVADFLVVRVIFHTAIAQALIIIQRNNQGQPSGVAVKFCFPGLGFAILDPRHGPTHHSSSHAVVGVPHVK